MDSNLPRSSSPPSCSLDTRQVTSALTPVGNSRVSSPTGMSTPQHKTEQVQPKDKMSLRELMETISAAEREESAEIAQLASRLSLYEKRQQRRQGMLKHIHAFLMEEEADNLSIQEGDVASQKGALSPEPVLNITSTAEHFSKTSADYPESQPKLMCCGQKRSELPLISPVQVPAVALSNTRAQPALQTLPLHDISSAPHCRHHALCLHNSPQLLMLRHRYD